MAKKKGKTERAVRRGAEKRFTGIFDQVRRTRRGEVDALTRALEAEEGRQEDYLAGLGQQLGIDESIAGGVVDAGSRGQESILRRFGGEQRSRGLREQEGGQQFTRALVSGFRSGREGQQEREAGVEVARFQMEAEKERLRNEAAARAAAARANSQNEKASEIQARLATQAIRIAEERDGPGAQPTGADYVAARDRVVQMGYAPREVYPVAAAFGFQSQQAEQQEGAQRRAGLQAGLPVIGQLGEGAFERLAENEAITTPFGEFNTFGALRNYLSPIYGEEVTDLLNTQYSDALQRRLSAEQKSRADAERIRARLGF